MSGNNPPNSPGPDPFTMLMFMQMQQNYQLNTELSNLRRQVEELKYHQLNSELDMLKGMVFGQGYQPQSREKQSSSGKK